MAKAFTARTRFVTDVISEQAEERERWAAEKRAADQARIDEANDYNMWSYIGTALGLAFGLGPAAPLIGAVTGNIAKWDVVDEEMAVMDPSDVGRWNVSENKEALEAINLEFKEQDTAEFWSGIKDIGTAALFTYQYGGGGAADTKFNPFMWGGSAGREAIPIWERFGLGEISNLFKPVSSPTRGFSFMGEANDEVFNID